jgi:cation:H+ antiporter
MLAAALLFVSSLAIILVGCHVFTNGVEWLGKRLGVSDGVVGSIFAGVGTALPETMIPLVAIAAGGSVASREIGIGAIVGAPFMLTTLSLPLGAVGVYVFTRMGRRTPFLSLDTRQMDLELRLFLLAFSVTMLAAYIPWMPVRWAMALFLVVMYAYYVRTTLRAETNVHDEEVPPLFLAPRRARPAYVLIALQVVLALTAIVGGAHLFVDAVEDLAVGIGISPLILSLLVTPIATELPEKMNSLIWLYQRKDQMAVGNITGAMVFQSTFPAVIGILGTPWALEKRVLVAGGMSITTAAILLFLLRLNGGLRPVHLLIGAVFYGAYAAYVLG